MSSILVLGAGMVGVSTALALQADGHEVTLVDRRQPGLETSYGNAGFIQAEAVEPYAMPRDFVSLVRMALRSGNDVNYHVSALPGQARALWAYFRSSRKDRHRAIARNYAPMVRRSTADHQLLIAASGSDHLIRRDGYYQIYRDAAALDVALRDADRINQTYSVGVETLDSGQLQRREPALKPGLAGAIRWTDTWTCLDPGGLVEAYARLFQDRGGKFECGDAQTLQSHGAGWVVSTQSGRIEAEQAAIALGPWSSQFLQRFGYNFPMIYKRGYHRHYANKGGLSIALHDPGNGMVLSPMNAGVRIATGAELALANAPATPRQLGRAVALARQLIELGDPVEKDPWMGRRPCLPNMQPFVGRLPNHRTLWANFGHGHQGFTLGPTTARLLSDRLTRDAGLSRRNV